MRSSRPYLIRALYEWIADNQLTPYVAIAADTPGVDVPRQYVEDGKIILNIAAHAVQNLNISNQAIEFDASFSGKPINVYAPIKSVLAIYARENGRGMVFNEEEEESDSGMAGNELPPQPIKYSHKPRKPKLTIVK